MNIVSSHRFILISLRRKNRASLNSGMCMRMAGLKLGYKTTRAIAIASRKRRARADLDHRDVRRTLGLASFIAASVPPRHFSSAHSVRSPFALAGSPVRSCYPLKLCFSALFILTSAHRASALRIAGLWSGYLVRSFLSHSVRSYDVPLTHSAHL
jgi:hypothetical protein